MAKIGIDLGTSNTLVAWVNSNNEPEIIHIDNEIMIPSIIYIEENGGNPSVGAAAQEMWASTEYDIRNSFRRWKMLIGNDATLGTLQTGGPKSDAVGITPEYLTTLMVEFVLREISSGVGGQPVESALVTVPHGWRRITPEKCSATRAAAACAHQQDGTMLNIQDVTISEPVAAAAYWIWAAGPKAQSDLAGKSVLVCDVGGGTFDLSLIRVVSEDQSLQVINATNNNLAGDYVDALICAWVCHQFNTKFDTHYAESAEDILREIVNPNSEQPILRRWMLDSREMKQRIAIWLRNLSDRTLKPMKKTFTDLNSQFFEAILDMETLETIMEPYYEKSRTLLHNFLGTAPMPYAIVFCGGGSKMHGMRDKIVAPVLRELYGSDNEQTIIDRLQINPRFVDQAIALGAALIANGLVKVEEKLLYNIGIVLTHNENAPQLLTELDFPKDTKEIVVIPILRKGDTLPTTATNRNFKLRTGVGAGDFLTVVVVIDDEMNEPWEQVWRISHPAGGEARSLDWYIRADLEGALTVFLQPNEGKSLPLKGSMQRTRISEGGIVLEVPNIKTANARPFVTPELLLLAIENIEARR